MVGLLIVKTILNPIIHCLFYSNPPKQKMMPPCIHHLTAQPAWLLLPSAVGFLILLKHSTSLATWLFTTFLRPPKNLKESYGSWALVTGATDGIGKAFATQLAQRGLNLILVSRNPTKLQSVSEEIRATSPTTTQIKTVAFDFSGGNLHRLTQLLEAETKGLDVGVLINNVGVTYPSARFFHEVEEEVWMNVAKVNVEGTTRVTTAVVKGMVKRRRGAIVNIVSGAGVVVRSPLVAIYGASKAYVDQLSRSLHAEYKQFGIDVQSQVPLYVATKLASKAASIDSSSLFVPSPDAYAKAAIRRIGYEARCTPFWAHSVQCFFAGLAPDSLLDTWRLSVGLKRRGDLHHEPSPSC